MQINKIFIVCLTLMILSSFASAQSPEIYSSLATHLYRGQSPNMSDAEYYKNSLSSNYMPPDATGAPLSEDWVEFPLLIGYSTERLTCFIKASGPSAPPPCDHVSEFINVEPFAFLDSTIAHYSTLEAITIPTEYSLRNRAFYIMENNISRATFLYPFASVYKPNEAPFYQEVIQSASASQLAFPGVHNSKLKDFVFYHLPRTDHYLETIGFYTPSQNFSKLNGTQKVFAFHALYPQEMQQNLAKPMLHLLRQETRFHEKAWR